MLGISGTDGGTVEIDDLYIWEAGDFLKKDSDCKFQKYAAEAILKHVDLKKTSH